MKLVEILAKELEEWPSNTDSIWQDHDSELRFYGNRDTSLSNIYVSELCDDCLRRWGDITPENRVTKEMWEAEKAKLSAQNTLVFDPIYCRDRIKEIDALVESLEEERVSLVQALEDEGFLLISAALISATPTEDMSDWRNWKEGDLVECVSDVVESCERMTVGNLYSVNIDCGDMVIIDDDNDPMHSVVGSKRIKWHSRPTTVNH